MTTSEILDTLKVVFERFFGKPRGATMGEINNFKKVRISQLKPYERNAKIHSGQQVEQIAASIKEFGFLSPCLIDNEYNIIAGHGRVEACKELGIEEVPCIFIEGLTEEQRRAYILADNRLTELGDWDMDLVQDELKWLDEQDFNIELTGFEIELETVEAQEDDFDMVVPEEPKSKYGDIYQLGNHRLMCGDSTSLDDVERLVGGVQVDLLLTDPPYNVDYEGKTKDKLKIANDKMEDDNFFDFLKTAFSNADMVMKEGAVFYIWHADSEGYNFRSACAEVGWVVRQCLIWNKNSMVMGRQDYQWKHEPCLYGWKAGAGHLWASDRKQTTVLNFDRPTKSDLHPTMKPIALFDYQIQNNTKGGDIVLDLFGGSGTTIMACEQNKRKAFVMEYDPKYVDVIIDRWETYTGQKAVLLNVDSYGIESNWKLP